MEFVSIDVTDGVAVLRLDRPKMNAISVQVQADLREAAAELAERDDVRVRGAVGRRARLRGRQRRQGDGRPHLLRHGEGLHLGQLGHHGHRPDPQAGRSPRSTATPWAGGCELALCADLRFAAEDAVFGQPEVLLGIIPGAGGTQRLTRLVGTAKAKDIIFTGRFVKADEALRIGLVDRVVPADKVLEEAVAYAAQFSGAAALAIRAAKECIDRGSEVDLDTGLEIERQQFAASLRDRGPYPRHHLVR